MHAPIRPPVFYSVIVGNFGSRYGARPAGAGSLIMGAVRKAAAAESTTTQNSERNLYGRVVC